MEASSEHLEDEETDKDAREICKAHVGRGFPQSGSESGISLWTSTRRSRLNDHEHSMGGRRLERQDSGVLSSLYRWLVVVAPVDSRTYAVRTLPVSVQFKEHVGSR